MRMPRSLEAIGTSITGAPAYPSTMACRLCRSGDGCGCRDDDDGLRTMI